MTDHGGSLLQHYRRASRAHAQGQTEIHNLCI
jgi:hypothetical protein